MINSSAGSNEIKRKPPQNNQAKKTKTTNKKQKTNKHRLAHITSSTCAFLSRHNVYRVLRFRLRAEVFLQQRI